MSTQLGFPWAPPGQGGPTGPALRPNGGLGRLLGDLGPGQDASVWNDIPHAGHTDATLYRRFPGGGIYPVDKVHLPK